MQLNQIAEEICRNHGYVTTDHLRRFCQLQGIDADTQQMNAVFRRDPFAWKSIGREKSNIPSNKGRKITKWIRVYH